MRSPALVLLALLGAASATAQTPSVPRSEPPRPDRFRADWQTLNGPWSFAFDDEDRGLAERWYAGDKPFARTIVVPYAFQTKLSGIAETGFHDVVWYRRAFTVPQAWQSRRLLLHFGAVDYRATVWVNGEEVARHEGGHTPFSADISRVAGQRGNVVVESIVIGPVYRADFAVGVHPSVVK